MKSINETAIVYCPFCRTAGNMNVTAAQRVVAGKGEKMKTVTSKTYHCESCGSFVCSIDEDEHAAAA